MDKKQLVDLKKIMQLCKQEGIKSIELDGLKMEFNPFAKVETKAKRSKKSAVNSDPIVEQQYSDEDILFWSSSGVLND